MHVEKVNLPILPVTASNLMNFDDCPAYSIISDPDEYIEVKEWFKDKDPCSFRFLELTDHFVNSPSHKQFWVIFSANQNNRIHVLFKLTFI